MAERLSRKELYDLVWSEPLKTLCSRFGISDVALRKTGARSEIPTPGGRTLEDTPAMPQVGDKVKPGRSEMVYNISRVRDDGQEVDLHVPGTNLERFRVPTDSLTYVDRKPPARTSNPFTEPEPASTSPAPLARHPKF